VVGLLSVWKTIDDDDRRTPIRPIADTFLPSPHRRTLNAERKDEHDNEHEWRRRHADTFPPLPPSH
jgi:hypothetical protein